jgi:hypothetical protein
MQTLLDWLHLCALASFLLLASFLQALIVTFYRVFPFPSLLDRLFLTSKSLQRYGGQYNWVSFNFFEDPTHFSCLEGGSHIASA